MKNPTAILSLLHEGPERNSVTRLFRDEPVLRWTLRRLAASQRLASCAILCWEDQADAVRAEVGGIDMLVKGPRTAIRELDAITAARSWADGWRSGLLSTCDFDLGFHGPWHLELAETMASTAIVLIDPASGLVDPQIIDVLIDHAERQPRYGNVLCPGGARLGRGADPRHVFATTGGGEGSCRAIASLSSRSTQSRAAGQ